MARPIENVWNYPRPPLLQPTKSLLRVIWKDPQGQETVVAQTQNGYRVLETSHPPTYYFPPDSISSKLLPSNARQTYCEWKGRAKYWDLAKQGDDATILSKGRIWSYPQPTSDFTVIKDYLCFYCTSRSDPAKVGQWHCYVDDDEAQAQEGDFYGSWITPEITGGPKGFKGGAGTMGW
ncbi:unnamed protein product [Sympodiomycopsis kandeliae]